MGLSNKLSCEAGSFSCHRNPHKFLQPEVLKLYFPALQPWVVWSILLPSCSSQFILMQMWDCPVCQTAGLRPSYHSGCFFFNLWLSDIHTVQFSASSDCGLFLIFLSFFWFCAEAKCIYSHFHLGQKSFFPFFTHLFQTHQI